MPSRGPRESGWVNCPPELELLELGISESEIQWYKRLVIAEDALETLPVHRVAS